MAKGKQSNMGEEGKRRYNESGEKRIFLTRHVFLFSL